MEPTKRNHINPCFWTAFWNIEHFCNVESDLKRKSARSQKVYSLEFNCPKILYKKVDDLHFVKGLGLAIIEKKDINHYSDLLNFQDEEDTLGIVVDIENHFSLIENDGGYHVLKKIVRNSVILNNEDRAYLSTFIVLHRLRSPLYFQFLFEQYKNEINPKLRVLKEFKDSISNEDTIANEAVPLFNSKWTIYITAEFTFPLSDSPIIKNKNIVWIVVSPKHLIEIDISKKFPGSIKYKREIKIEKLAKIKKQIIENTFLGVISTDEKSLSKIQKSNTWKMRKAYIDKIKSSTSIPFQ